MNAGNWSSPLALIALAIVGSIACERGERHYSKVSEVGGEIARGWIPTWITSDATDIREMYDLDTNANCGVFTFSQAGAAELATACQDVEIVEQRLPLRRPTQWWPSGLTTGDAQNSRFRFVVCKGPSRDAPGRDRYGDYAAIDPRANKAYFWWLPG